MARAGRRFIRVFRQMSLVRWDGSIRRLNWNLRVEMRNGAESRGEWSEYSFFCSGKPMLYTHGSLLLFLLLLFVF